MDEFIHKTVTSSISLERVKADPIDCIATRTRTSKGFGSIVIRIDSEVVLKLSSDTYGNGYEDAALRIAELLQLMASEPCALPGAA